MQEVEGQAEPQSSRAQAYSDGDWAELNGPQQFPFCSRDFQIAYPVLTVQDSALCYVKHPARLRNRGYNLAFSHNGNC